MTGIELGFPIWVRATHWFNFLFMTMLVRSGIAILAGHPKLYWNQDCRPGSDWLRFSRKRMPKDRLWTSKDEEVGLPVLAGPARAGTASGLGRYWHFTAVHGWIYATAIYVVLMLAMPPQWRRLIPSSWTIIPDAWHDFVAYLTFHLPAARDHGQPGPPLQRPPEAHLLRRGLRPDAAPDAHRRGDVADDRGRGSPGIPSCSATARRRGASTSSGWWPSSGSSRSTC